MFDVERRGRVADDQNRRAVSNALSHPGITDFPRGRDLAISLALRGRGRGAAPGAVAQPTNGVAPAPYGAHNTQELAAETVERTRARVCDRYRHKISAAYKMFSSSLRYSRCVVEQGEAVVFFIVRPDGELGEGPRIVKSSGFEGSSTRRR